MLFLAGGTGLAPFLSMLDKIEQDGGSEHPIHLIFGVTNDADLVKVDELEGYAARMPNFTVRLLRRGRGEQPPEQGLRHPPHEARAPQRRDRRHLPVRSAADGGRGAQVPRRPGHRRRRASTTRSSPARAWSARSASRTSRPSTRTRRSTPGWRWSWGPPSWWWASSRPSSSPSTGGWRRRPGSSSRTATSPTPPGSGRPTRPSTCSRSRPPGTPTLVEAYRKLLVQEYMGQVLTPSVDLVGDITQDHLDIVDAFERGDFEALRRDIIVSTPSTRRRPCGPASRSRGARAEMIFPGRFDGKVAGRHRRGAGARGGGGHQGGPRGGCGRPGGPLGDRARGQREAGRRWSGQTISLIADLEQYGDCADRDGRRRTNGSAASTS